MQSTKYYTLQGRPGNSRTSWNSEPTSYAVFKALLKTGRREGISAIENETVIFRGRFKGAQHMPRYDDICYMKDGAHKYMFKTNLHLINEEKVLEVVITDPVAIHLFNYSSSNKKRKTIYAADYAELSAAEQDNLYVSSGFEKFDRNIIVKFSGYENEISLNVISVKTIDDSAQVAESSSDESDDLSPTMPVANLAAQMTSAAKTSTNEDTEDLNDTSEDEKSAKIVVDKTTPAGKTAAVSTKPILGKRAKKPEPIVHSSTDSSDEDTEIIGKPTNWMNSPRTKYMIVHDEPDLGKKRKSIPSAKMIAAGSSSASSSSTPFQALVKGKKNKKGQ